MKKLDFELDVGTVATGELRPILDQAIGDHFSDGMLRHEWDGDVLRLSGPGARGSVVHESGSLRLKAELRPPASFVHRMLRRKIEAALSDVTAKMGPGDRKIPSAT